MVNQPAKIIASLKPLPVALSVPEQAILRMNAGVGFRTKLLIANEGDSALHWTSEQPLHLAYRWFDQNGACIEADGHRSSIPGPLGAGSSVEVELSGTAPALAGSYRLVASLILEGVHWACDVADSGWLTLDVDVVVPPAWPRELENSRGGKALRGALAAASLERLLLERPLNRSARDEVTIATPAPAEPIIHSPAETTKRPRASLGRRIRAWIRHMLGIVEMRQAVEELLRRTAEHERQVLAARAELADLANAHVEQSRHFEEIQTRHAAIEGHLPKLDAIGAGMRSLGKDLKKLAGAAAKTEEVNAALQDKTHNALASVGKSLSAQRNSLGMINHAAESQRVVLDQMQRWLEQIDRSSDSLRNELQRELREAESQRVVLDQMQHRLERIDRSSDSLRNELQRELREGEAIQTLLSGLNELRSWTQTAGDLDRIGSIDEAIRHLPERFESDILAARDALDRKLSGEISAAWQQLGNEMRGGAVAIELMSTLRQLASWARQAGDLGAIATIEETTSALAARLAAVAADQLPLLRELTLHASYNSAKLDALLSRELIALPAAGLVLARNRFGLLAIQEDDVAAIAYYSSGDLPEPGTVAVIERLLEPGDSFVDIGANVGAHTLVAARHVGPSGKVIAVEPMPVTARTLETTVAINGVSRIVDVHECALGAAPGRASMFPGKTSGHSSMLQLEQAGEPVQVEVKRGSQLIGRRKPRLIKIDVEGWELDVLEGIGSSLESAKVSLIVECSPVHIRRRGSSPQAWLERLRQTGMKIWLIDDGRLALRPLKKVDEVGDGGANLFLARALPAALESMVDDG
ncbi:MAG: FkbM family methyltransferase [Pseudomonadota bacterium]|nr:FkbM family methyltransferase [Pseudomonadota bacterium]